MATDFSNKCAILSDLWINYKDNVELQDFIEYNDLGLPLAYFIHTELVVPNETAKNYIDETFDLWCAALELPLDGEYNNLDQMLKLKGD